MWKGFLKLSFCLTCRQKAPYHTGETHNKDFFFLIKHTFLSEVQIHTGAVPIGSSRLSENLCVTCRQWKWPKDPELIYSMSAGAAVSPLLPNKPRVYHSSDVMFARHPDSPNRSCYNCTEDSRRCLKPQSFPVLTLVLISERNNAVSTLYGGKKSACIL